MSCTYCFPLLGVKDVDFGDTTESITKRQQINLGKTRNIAFQWNTEFLHIAYRNISRIPQISAKCVLFKKILLTQAFIELKRFVSMIENSKKLNGNKQMKRKSILNSISQPKCRRDYKQMYLLRFGGVVCIAINFFYIQNRI